MRIDPVFVLAPDPEPESRPPRLSRRSFLLAVSGAALAGTTLGFVVGRRTGDHSEAGSRLESRAPGAGTTGDLSDMDRWAIDVARSLDTAPLVAQLETFLVVFHTRPTLRDELLPGIEKLVHAVLEGAAGDADRRRQVAAATIQAIEVLPPGDDLRTALPRLRRYAR